MNTGGINAWRKLGALAVLCLIVALGEQRSAGFAAVASTPSSFPAASATSVAFESGGALRVGADEDGPSITAGPADALDEVHLVPAIYAWDPDVRFIYFRHVSKWM